VSERISPVALILPSVCAGFVLSIGVRYAGADAVGGREIAACPANYAGMVGMTDERTLDGLGRVAKDLHVSDSRAEPFMTQDVATLPGELACTQALAGGARITVLSPSGMEALQRDVDVTSEPLPDGLMQLG
jgi:hypothetical protein